MTKPSRKTAALSQLFHESSKSPFRLRLGALPPSRAAGHMTGRIRRPQCRDIDFAPARTIGRRWDGTDGFRALAYAGRTKHAWSHAKETSVNLSWPVLHAHGPRSCGSRSMDVSLRGAILTAHSEVVISNSFRHHSKNQIGCRVVLAFPSHRVGPCFLEEVSQRIGKEQNISRGQCLKQCRSYSVANYYAPAF